MNKKWVISIIIILIAVIFMFLFKDIKFRIIIVCITSALVSAITRNIE